MDEKLLPIILCKKKKKFLASAGLTVDVSYFSEACKDTYTIYLRYAPYTVALTGIDIAEDNQVRNLSIKAVGLLLSRMYTYTDKLEEVMDKISRTFEIQM